MALPDTIPPFPDHEVDLACNPVVSVHRTLTEDGFGHHNTVLIYADITKDRYNVIRIFHNPPAVRTIGRELPWDLAKQVALRHWEQDGHQLEYASGDKYASAQ